MKKYNDQLKRINDNYTKSLKRLANKFRREVIKPKCKKYNLIFVDGNFYAAPDYKEVGFVECKNFGLLPIHKMLGAETTFKQLIQYVSDYNPKKVVLKMGPDKKRTEEIAELIKTVRGDPNWNKGPLKESEFRE